MSCVFCALVLLWVLWIAGRVFSPFPAQLFLTECFKILHTSNSHRMELWLPQFMMADALGQDRDSTSRNLTNFRCHCVDRLLCEVQVRCVSKLAWAPAGERGAPCVHIKEKLEGMIHARCFLMAACCKTDLGFSGGSCREKEGQHQRGSLQSRFRSWT